MISEGAGSESQPLTARNRHSSPATWSLSSCVYRKHKQRSNATPLDNRTVPLRPAGLASSSGDVRDCRVVTVQLPCGVEVSTNYTSSQRSVYLDRLLPSLTRRWDPCPGGLERKSQASERSRQQRRLVESTRSAVELCRKKFRVNGQQR